MIDCDKMEDQGKTRVEREKGRKKAAKPVPTAGTTKKIMFIQTRSF